MEEKHCQYRKCDTDSRKIVQSNENKKSAYEDGSRNEFYVTSTFLCLHLYPVYKNKRKNRWQDAESNFWKLRQTGGQKICHKTREKVLSIP